MNLKFYRSSSVMHFILDISKNVSVKSDIVKRGEVYIESSPHVSFLTAAFLVKHLSFQSEHANWQLCTHIIYWLTALDKTPSFNHETRDKMTSCSDSQANDWSKRAVLMTPDFIYFSYSEAGTEEGPEVMRERSEVVTSRAPVAQKLSELHLAEPWVGSLSNAGSFVSLGDFNTPFYHDSNIW